MADAGEGQLYELDDLVVQPGTYFNPQTEVVVIVDDSTSIDQEIFSSDAYEGADWVRISDDVPIDEGALDESLETFQARFHPTGTSADPEAADDDGDEDDDADDDFDDDGDDPDDEED